MVVNITSLKRAVVTLESWFFKTESTMDLYRKDRFLFRCALVFLTCFSIVSSSESGDDPEDVKFYPKPQEMEHNFPKYPYQEYVQVRKVVTVEHVPRYQEDGSETVSNSLPSVRHDKSLSKSSADGGAATSNHEAYQPYYQPPLKEEIFVKKKQEVYEERGYGDSAYDHSAHGEQYKHEGDTYGDDEDYAGASSKLSPLSKSKEEKVHILEKSESQRKAAKARPPMHPLISGGSSSPILKYIAENLHDKDASSQGFYRARSHIYCPEVIDFDLSAKSQKMGQGGGGNKGKRRLHGLGAKINCLKNKYFGSATQILPAIIFPHPAQSRHIPITMGTMEDFLKEIKTNFYK